MMSYPPNKAPGSGAPGPGPDPAGLMKNPALLRSLLQSPETRRLIGLLQQQGNLQAAAEKAKAGDVGELKSMLERLQHSREGESALEEMERKLQK